MKRQRADDRLLAIFVKQPVAGQAKTRLALATGAEFALRVAHALLSDSLDRFERVDTGRVIVHEPADAIRFFADLARDRYQLLPQAEGDLGARLRNFFDDARVGGFARIVAIGADSPTLPIQFIEEAFRLLETHDVVLGPACDGGYYLIGCGPKTLSIFDDIPWSTPQVLEKTVERVREASGRLALLPPWYDVDTADDWAMLRGHLLAMRQAGIDPGTPRVERLAGADAGVE